MRRNHEGSSEQESAELNPSLLAAFPGAPVLLIRLQPTWRETGREALSSCSWERSLSISHSIQLPRSLPSVSSPAASSCKPLDFNCGFLSVYQSSWRKKIQGRRAILQVFTISCLLAFKPSPVSGSGCRRDTHFRLWKSFFCFSSQV